MEFKSIKSPYACEQNDKLMIIRQQKKARANARASIFRI